MKTKSLLLAILMLGISAFSAEAPSTVLTLKGFYLKESNVSICIHKKTDTEYVFMNETKSFKAYKLHLEVGESYMITFTKDGISKDLYVTPVFGGTFELDVNFRNNSSARLVYDEIKHHYRISILDNLDNYVSDTKTE